MAGAARTTAPTSRKPAFSAFSQQQLWARRPALTPALTAKLMISIGVACFAVGGAIFNTANDLRTLVKRYDDAATCASGFFPTSAEQAMQMSFNGAGTTCTVTLTAKSNMNKPVYVYYELSNFFQNHRAFVRDLDYFQLMGKPSQGLCTTHEKTSAGAEISPCGVQAWSFFNDSYAVAVNGAATTIDSANIAWKSDLKYKLGDYAPTNMNTDQATRGGGQITGNVDTDEDFATWMRTAALSKFRKLVGVINADIAKGDTITFTIQNRYNTYKFNGEKAVVLATNSWIGGRNLVFPAFYFLAGCLCSGLGAVGVFLHIFGDKFKSESTNEWSTRL